MHARLVARKLSVDGSDAVRVADDKRQSVTADLSSDGRAEYEVIGRSPQNEEGSLEACQILAHRLQRDGNPVGEPRTPTGPEHGIDWEIPTDNGVLHVQVTHVAPSGFWKNLNLCRKAKRRISEAQAAEDILAAIDAKAWKATDLARTVLVLDATTTSAHAMASLAQAARKRCVADVARHGYSAVWIVGPSVDLVFRIGDESSG